METGVRLSGNLAQEAVLFLPSGNDADRVDGDAICFEDMLEFAEAVKCGGLKKNSVIVLRFGQKGYSGKPAEEYLKLLKVYYPRQHFMVLSDQRLPETEAVGTVHVKTSPGSAEEPFFYICNGDHIRLEPEVGALYWYVADAELIYRKSQQRAVL